MKPKIYSIISVRDVSSTGKTYRNEIGEMIEQKDGSKKLRLYMFPNLELWVKEKITNKKDPHDQI